MDEAEPTAIGPVTVGGWYRLTDGRAGEYQWIDGAPQLVRTADSIPSREEEQARIDRDEREREDMHDREDALDAAPAMSAREARRRSCGSDLICDGCGEAIEPGGARFPDETRAVFCSMCDDAPSDDDYAHLAPYDQGDDE